MGFLDTLLGRNKLRRPRREQYFAVVTAEVALQGRADVRLTDRAGLVFNPVESSFFENLEREIRGVLEISERATGTRFDVEDDTYGTKWVTLQDEDFEDLATTLHLVGETITEHGYGDRLLAAVFGLEFDGKQAYFIYNVKRGSFYPLVLSAPQSRDNAAEMRLGAVMEQAELPVEKQLEAWYSLWGIPF